MNLIISTPQGEAEVSVVAVHESVTIGDLLRRVLSSAPPTLVYIDGRPVPSGTLMNAAGLVTGTVIDTTAPLERPRQVEVTLVQAAGEGGGSRRPLDPGRYSLGTARRANVAPLSFNQVLVPRCEVVVEHSGKVIVTANQGDLDGHLATAASSWEQQRLRIGHRVFRLDGAVQDRATSLLATPLGQLNFARPPRDAATTEPEPDGRARQGGRRLRRARNNRAEPPPPPPIAAVDPARLAFDNELDTVRRTHLDLGEVIRRATQLSQRLWERRPADDDAFVFSVGLADQPWVGETEGRIAHRDATLLPSVPVLLDLVNQRGVGFASTPPQARAAARALVLQACVAHSPTDLDVVVLSNRAGASRWEWIKWLPHAHGSHGVQLLSDEEATIDWVNSQRTLTTVVASIQSLGQAIKPSRLTLAVVDDPALWRGRAAMLRGLFAEAQLPVRFVAITDRADDVPAVCTTVVRIAANGAAEVDYPISGPTVTDVVPFVLEHEVAVAAARRLSPLEDHTAQLFTKPVLPPVVPLASLVDPDGLEMNRVLDRWAAGPRSRRLRVAVGVGESGTVELDLSEDGPHVLIVGSRRSGKTELLRSSIASLISVNDPATVNIICVEPSEGASFGAFAGVDHVVGAIDSFDEHEGFRLLRALRSEVDRRTRILADSHVTTFSEYHYTEHATDEARPMPRLVIVVDDADDVMARHGAFLPQLVEMADPSRHLGLHLFVASERLSRSLENALKKFANIRIGLRMNDPAEAIALTGGREPVQISSNTPGRGVLKVGDADSVPVQFASASAESSDLMEVTPFVIARDLNAAERKMATRPAGAASEVTAPSGLRQFTEVVADAASRHPNTTRRQILCPQLPAVLLYDLIATAPPNTTDDGAVFALSDLPDDHMQNTRRWNPARDGNLLILGGTPAERSSSLATLFIAAVDRFPIDRLHGYVIDCPPGPSSRLTDLESLPACGAVASPEDPDRILRVLGGLTTELDRRAASDGPSGAPHIVLIVNDIGALMRTLEVGGEFEPGREMLDRLTGEGPAHGITTLMSSAGEHGAPARMLGQFQQRIVLHLDDRGAYRTLDVSSSRIPTEAFGRAITVPDLVEIQIASIADLPAAVAARSTRGSAVHRPPTIARTPENVNLDELGRATEFLHDTWRLPVGLETRTLEPGVLHLHAPAGALILGDAGAGKSTLLINLARCALGISAEVDIHAIAATWSPLLLLPRLTSATTMAGIDRWAGEFFDRTDRSRLVLIDDSDRLEGPVFERLASLNDPGLVVVVAGRTRVLELPSHWTAPLRGSRSGVILRPLAGDGAMFGLNLRVTSAHPGLGRALLVHDDTTTPVLLAGPSDDAEGGPP